jgi:hypothetical protein
MQVSATLIAAQQAAREAQARFHADHVAPAAPGFTAALEKTPGGDGFSPLPLKQTATPARAPAAAAPQTQPGAPLGSHVDITI